MSATTGIMPIVVYNQATDPLKVAALLAIIPDPDNKSSSGAQAGGVNGTLNTYLDEMSPGCAAQLRVELTALGAAVT